MFFFYFFKKNYVINKIIDLSMKHACFNFFNFFLNACFSNSISYEFLFYMIL